MNRTEGAFRGLTPFLFEAREFMREKIRIGLIGCGKISHSYMSTLGRFEFLEVSACADSVREKAE